jgi:hypothetical protein
VRKPAAGSTSTFGAVAAASASSLAAAAFGSLTSGASAAEQLQLKAPTCAALCPGGDGMQVVVGDEGRLVVISFEHVKQGRRKVGGGGGGEDHGSTLVAGRWHTLAGHPLEPGFDDSTCEFRAVDKKWVASRPAKLARPSAVLALPGGEGFLVADGPAVRFCSWPQGHVVTVRSAPRAGKKAGPATFAAGGGAASPPPHLVNGSLLKDPAGLCLDETGALVVADTAALLRLEPSGHLGPRPTGPASAKDAHPWGHSRWLRGRLEVLVVAAPAAGSKSQVPQRWWSVDGRKEEVGFVSRQ